MAEVLWDDLEYAVQLINSILEHWTASSANC